jgi:hypothetical protein
MVFATILAVLFAAILGALICFLGYRAFLVMLPIWGFFGGFWLGAAGISLLLGEGFLATVTGWVVGFIIGLLGAVLSYMFYAVAVAIIAGALGMAFASGIMTALGFSPGLIVTLVSVFNGIVVAVLALVFNLQKYVVIFLTSLIGADLIVLAGLLLFGVVGLGDLQGGSLIAPVIREHWLSLVAFIALAIAGIVVQVRANRTYIFTRDAYVEAWG